MNIEEIKKDIIDSLEGKEKVRCSNCDCEFFPGRHDEILCKYLNR